MSTPKLTSQQSTIGEEPLSKKSAENETDISSERSTRSPSQEPVKCAICLGDVVDRSCSNNCGHEFCFGCLLEWSKVKPECPLCKVSFRAIYHNFRENDHDEYIVPQPNGAARIALTLGSPLSPTFRWAPFFQLLEATNRANHSHSHNHPHTPMSQATVNVYENNIITFPPPPPQPPRPPASFLMPTNPFSSSARPEYFGDIIHEHRRTQDEAIQLPGYQNRRRRYDRDEWVEPFGSALQSGSMVFDSIEYIRTHPNSITRLRNFLYREINVLLGLFRTREQMGFVYDLIIHLLNHYDIRSGDFRDMVITYFGSKTAHFQHELYHFMLSGLRMEEYDRVAEYRSASFSRMSHSVPPVITLDSDDENENAATNLDVSNPNSNSNSGDSNVIPFVGISGNSSATADLILLETSSSSDDDDDAIIDVSTPPVKRHSIFRQDRKIPKSIPLRRLRSQRTEIANRRAVEYNSETVVQPRLAFTTGDSTPDESPYRRRRTLVSAGVTDESSSRGSIIEIDPTMPRLEPEVPFSTIDLDQFPPMSLGNTMIINSTRATAASSAVVTNSTTHTPISSALLLPMNQNMTRPSVLTCSRTRNNVLTSQERLFEELERAIASESSYSSPIREAPRPLGSPDFPVLSYRAEQDNLREERLSEWGSGSPFLSSLPFSRNDPQPGRNVSPPSLIPSPLPQLTYAGYPSHEEENNMSFQHSLADFTASLARPPRPSCIQSSSRSRAPARSSTPPFRIDLFPNGISNAEVMDLSRSAGLIPSSSAAATRPSSPAPIRSRKNTFTASGTLTNHNCNHTTTTNMPVAHSSVASSLRPLELLMSRGKACKTKQEPTSIVSEDELECLGSFPIKKKPPLAVITLSSDDEREPSVKPELHDPPLLPPSPTNENEFMNRFLSDHLFSIHDDVGLGLDAFPFEPTFSEDTEPLPEPMAVNDNQSYAHIQPIPLSPERIAGPSTGTLRFLYSKSNISTVTLSASSTEDNTLSSKNGSNARKKRPKKHKKKKHKSSKRRRVIFSSSSESSDDEGQDSSKAKSSRSREIV